MFLQYFLHFKYLYFNKYKFFMLINLDVPERFIFFCPCAIPSYRSGADLFLSYLKRLFWDNLKTKVLGINLMNIKEAEDLVRKHLFDQIGIEYHKELLFQFIILFLKRIICFHLACLVHRWCGIQLLWSVFETMSFILFYYLIEYT